MASNYYKPVTDLLRENGFTLLRYGKGSHQVWVNHPTGRKVSVPAKIVSRHTANAIIGSAEIEAKI